MRNLLTSLLLLATLGTALAQDDIYNLRECIALAVDNNISVQQSLLDIKQAEIERSDALGVFVPRLNGNASYSVNTGASINPVTNEFQNQRFASFTAGVGAGLTLFDGLRNFKGLQRAKLSQLAAQYRNEKLVDDIALAVANGYLQVLFNKENVKVLVEQHNLTQGQIDQTQALVDAGVAPRGDLLELRATYAQEETQIINAQNAVLISKISLAQLLNLENYETFDIAQDDYELPPSDILNQGVGTIIDAAREGRFEIKIAEQNTLLAEKDYEIARGGYLPTLSAFAQYNTRYADNDFFNRDFTEQLYQNDGTAYGFQLQIPFLNGFATRNSVRRSRINIENNKLAAEQAELDLESNVYQAYNDALGSKAAYEASLVAVEAREQAFSFAQDRFDVGMMNSFDFTQAQVQLTNAQTTLLQNKYDYIFKLKTLELLSGVPVEQIKL